MANNIMFCFILLILACTYKTGSADYVCNPSTIPTETCAGICNFTRTNTLDAGSKLGDACHVSQFNI